MSIHNMDSISVKRDARADKNKEELLAEIMDSYSKKVYLLAYSFVKNHAHAEDVAQEVFIKCFKNIEKYRGEASISTWVYRITVNTSKDFIRKNRLNKLKEPINFLDNIRSKENTEETYLIKEEKERMLHLLFALPMKYKEVLLLYYYHELKINEIAKTLNLNSNTVKTRMARGKEKLKKKLVKEDGIYG